MKLDVKRRDNGMVEIRLEEEGGKLTVYLCEDGQAAIFKLAQLIFSMGDDPRENRRSILVGTFEKERPKPDLNEKAKDILEELKKAGFVPALLPVSPQPYVVPIPWAPNVDPNVVPISPTYPGTGGPPYTITWGSAGTSAGTTTGGYTTYNNSGDVWFTNSGGTYKLVETPVSNDTAGLATMSSSGLLNTFCVSTTTVTPSGGQ
jgi:hypothetical protein